MNYQTCETFNSLILTMLAFPGEGVMADMYGHRETCVVCQDNYRFIRAYIRRREAERRELERERREAENAARAEHPALTEREMEAI